MYKVPRISICFIALLALVTVAPSLTYGQGKKVTNKQTTNEVTQTTTSQPQILQQNSSTIIQTEVQSETDKKQELPIEVEIKKSNEPESKEGIEYITVYSKEKGIKIYLEAGGGPLISGGVIYRFNPIFGLGIGGGYTPLPYRNFGPILDLRGEVVPIYFYISGEELKLNIIGGFRGVFFFGSMTQYMGIDIGAELLIKAFQYIIPSIHSYIYLAGNSVVPQFSLQLRTSF